MGNIEQITLTVNGITERNGGAALNKAQACKELNIGLTKLNELLSSGELKYRKVGKQYRINALTIAEMLV